jgi:hypothetical protein
MIALRVLRPTRCNEFSPVSDGDYCGCDLNLYAEMAVRTHNTELPIECRRTAPAKSDYGPNASDSYRRGRSPID